MIFKRIVPIVLIKDGLLVRSQSFKFHQAIGDPIPTIRRLSDWNADEIVLLNISGDNKMDSRRNDKYHNLGATSFAALVKEASKCCHCPLSVGGGIRSLAQISELFRAGADKVIFNTAIFEAPSIVSEAVRQYGSQSICASLDVAAEEDRTILYNNRTKQNYPCDLKYGIELAEQLGVGELIISSVKNDGAKYGVDKKIFLGLNSAGNIPVLVNSGVAEIRHFEEALNHPKVSGVCASNIFYFTELSYPIIKRSLLDRGSKFTRPAKPGSSYFSREPSYDPEQREKLLLKGNAGSKADLSIYNGDKQQIPKYCTRCFYSSFSATPMQFDHKGLCMGCRVSDAKFARTSDEMQKRHLQLVELTSETKGNGKYDCIVSVSGGKDSYYQTHYVTKELGLKPLLVTYNGNNYSEVGWRNLWRMREVFDCDHIVISPSIKTIKRLNKLAFIAMGDMNWHAHVGIFTTAPRVAVQQNIPIIFWGEHGYADLCGQFSMDDLPEMNYRERTEHAGRGFDWNFFEGLDGLKSQDLEPWKYPSDEALFALSLRQIHLGHYIPWEANDHLQMMISEYGFEISSEAFERTYRVGSNLDDIHENGIHDYLKYIKFGYGRCTDHASKDIRANKISREKAIKLIKRMDHIKPKDLTRWLNYVNMDENEFDRIADHFRDPRVWKYDSEKGWHRHMLEY